jgi:MoaA/NifB/PqqE/SkfB family radical SAM enzyme
MPIKRFLNDLLRQNKFEAYMDLLVTSFNPKSVKDVMCRSLISVSYDGFLYDCDFNQMLEMPIANEKISVWDLDSFDNCFFGKPIYTAAHCFACTAGAGSSCGGALGT